MTGHMLHTTGTSSGTSPHTHRPAAKGFIELSDIQLRWLLLFIFYLVWNSITVSVILQGTWMINGWNEPWWRKLMLNQEVGVYMVTKKVKNKNHVAVVAPDRTPVCYLQRTAASEKYRLWNISQWNQCSCNFLHDFSHCQHRKGGNAQATFTFTLTCHVYMLNHVMCTNKVDEYFEFP